MNVLVPLDGSLLAESTLQSALRLAGAGTLFLVRVLPSDPGRGEFIRAEHYLEAQRKRLEEAGATVRWDLEGGDPVERILVVARERAPDYVAIATRGLPRHRGSEDESVAEQVLRASGVPVLLVNPKAMPKAREAAFGSLLVPLDDSAVSDAILPHVAQVALAFDSEVTLLRIEPRRGRSSARVVDARLRAQRMQLAQSGLTVRARTRAGDPTEQILEAAKDFDVVCMATHGRTGLRRWWYGSVANEVVRRSPCPVLVIRPDVEA